MSSAAVVMGALRVKLKLHVEAIIVLSKTSIFSRTLSYELVHQNFSNNENPINYHFLHLGGRDIFLNEVVGSGRVNSINLNELVNCYHELPDNFCLASLLKDNNVTCH